MNGYSFIKGGNTMKSWLSFLGVVVLAVSLLSTRCAATPKQEVTPIKIGMTAELTGPAAFVTKSILDGFNFVLDKNGHEVAGRKIELIVEDVGGDVTLSVEKAKKLVQEDKVVALFGPVLEPTTNAVAAYAATVNIPHIYAPALDLGIMNNKTFFMTMGAARGQNAKAGEFSYEQLGLRRCSVIIQDYSYGYICAAGFLDGFLGKGGTVASIHLVPFGTADLAPYLSRLGKDVDCVATFLLPPGSTSLPRQLREYGLKIPILYINVYGIEDAILQQLGDDAVGDYGFSHYSWTIDTPINKQFVAEYQTKYGRYPTTSDMQGYVPAAVFLEAVKITEGDTTPEKLMKALTEVNIDTPQGPIQMSSDRMGICNEYAFQIAKIQGMNAFKVLKEYPLVQPVFGSFSIDDYLKKVTP
jgi:branched-chain amino acid transport system substrate-binding protein